MCRQTPIEQPFPLGSKALHQGRPRARRPCVPHASQCLTSPRYTRHTGNCTRSCLRSRRGSSRSIYLDFNGHLTSGTAWNKRNGSDIETPSFDIDGNPNDFSSQERQRIVAVWRAVAEDFAPFDVDVTTGAGACPGMLVTRGHAVSAYLCSACPLCTTHMQHTSQPFACALLAEEPADKAFAANGGGGRVCIGGSSTDCEP